MPNCILLFSANGKRVNELLGGNVDPNLAGDLWNNAQKCAIF
jgi:hypothetical protein